ncbi:MAG: hypothetical protein GX197_02020 [Firmicutes bacterium]|nr:hypothetical protein [Bacillota bacterium]
MLKNFPYRVFALLLIGAIMGYYWTTKIAAPARGDSGYMPACLISGDVHRAFTLDSMETFTPVEFSYKGEYFHGIPLADIVQHAEPITTDFDLLLIGQDGLSAQFSGNKLEGSHITFTTKNGWEAINLNHPVSSNIKKLEKIIVMAKEPVPEYGVNIITPTQNLHTLMPGRIYRETISTVPYFEGTSTVSQPDGEYSVSIFSRRTMFSLKDLLQDVHVEKLVAMGREGEYAYIDLGGFLELRDNAFHYVTAQREDEIKNLAGIVANPPARSITDLYHDTIYYLTQGENVLILYLDGFGYHQYLHAKEAGFAPFMATLPEAEPALAVYQPVTNAGFAAMITGKTPAENGVYSRAQKDLKVPTIFGIAQELGKKAALIEGHIKILNTEIEPVLNIDANKDGLTDDEIFASAQTALRQNYDLLFVHFHSIDDLGHSFGDLHQNTLKQIQVVDGYVQELLENWNGKVIILSDHGMHATEEAGNHGVFRYEDLIIPYIVAQGGQS